MEAVGAWVARVVAVVAWVASAVVRRRWAVRRSGVGVGWFGGRRGDGKRGGGTGGVGYV